MRKPALMVGLGEVLWDLLPSGKVLGGAPANFAYMASALGDTGIVASRVGSDSLGRAARQQMEALGLSTKYLQQDSEFHTGTADVVPDVAGQPAFTIGEPSAWDRLEWTSEWEDLSAAADAICFGSLAQRSSLSAETIARFLRNSRPEALRIFDVNLRQSYFSREVLERSLRLANIVKLTDQELAEVGSLLGFGSDGAAELARHLLCECDLKLVCVTRGARGSLLVAEGETAEHSGFPVKVVDAVGAGDAFTACLAHHFMRGRTLNEISEYGNRFASWVATQVGATPAIDRLKAQELFAQ
jgi:fructokinase